MKHFLASDKEGVSLGCIQGVLIPYLGAGYLSHSVSWSGVLALTARQMYGVREPEQIPQKQGPW